MHFSNTDSGQEQALDPGQRIIDPHLHFWDILPRFEGEGIPQRFLMPDALDVINQSGHNITHTVFVECHAMYRQNGPAELASLGETEFVNGIAAMSASGNYGSCRLAHRIVASANPLLGSALAPVVDAHRAVGGERLVGMRFNTAFSESGLFGAPCDPALKEIMRHAAFTESARVLADRNLSLDVWCLHTQLDDVISLADELPDLVIVLDHVGTPEKHGKYAGREGELLVEWRMKIKELALRPNVYIKLGGMGMNISVGFDNAVKNNSSKELADQWRSYVETCIAAFGPDRCMFESNFPPDNAAGSYGAVWNAFKILAKGYSETEKDALFFRTAADVYHIAI